MNNQFTNTLNQVNNNNLTSNFDDDDDDDDDDEMEDDNPSNHIFQCTWSTSMPNYALELLLRRLKGDTSSLFVFGGMAIAWGMISVLRKQTVRVSKKGG